MYHRDVLFVPRRYEFKDILVLFAELALFLLSLRSYLPSLLFEVLDGLLLVESALDAEVVHHDGAGELLLRLLSLAKHGIVSRKRCSCAATQTLASV